MIQIQRHTFVLGAFVFAAVAACSKAETPKVADTARPDSAASGMAAAPAMPASAPATGMMDPGTASQSDLVAAGMSDAEAGALVAGRPYANMVAVDKMLAKSLSEGKRDSVYARLWMPIDLNKASKEEILLIPGIGAKMLKEFEEYRPYTSMEQFRRDIGKYVDKAELARLEQYVMIK